MGGVWLFGITTSLMLWKLTSLPLEAQLAIVKVPSALMGNVMPGWALDLHRYHY